MPETPQRLSDLPADDSIVAGGEIRSVAKMRTDKNMSNQEDLQLLARISQGDQKSLATLYDKYARLIYSLTLRIVRNEEEARELQQDVFLQVWQKAALFDNERGSFVTWLVTLAHNKSINTLRSRRYKKSAKEAKQDIADITSDSTVSHHTPLSDAMESDERRHVLAALEQIPELQRKALYLSYYEGYSQSEIAEMLGEPLGTIKTRMRKGMMKLVAILGDG
ncbi:MAG: sigma-70 family RNA polymerase sigma factor [Candidatus Kapaibacterium sp.]